MGPCPAHCTDLNQKQREVEKDERSRLRIDVEEAFSVAKPRLELIAALADDVGVVDDGRRDADQDRNAEGVQKVQKKLSRPFASDEVFSGPLGVVEAPEDVERDDVHPEEGV